MIYAVIDTNVFVSAYLTHHLESSTSKIVQLLFKGEIRLLYNEGILSEYEDVLSRSRLRISSFERETLLEYIRANGIPTPQTAFNETLVDEDDRVFYEITLTKDDSFLITGNLKHFPADPRVVTPAQMLRIMGK